MEQWKRNQRDIDTDTAQVFQHKGYTFPKYEGNLTQDEFNSKKTFYAYWGGVYMPATAIRYHVSTLIDRRQLVDLAA